MLRPAGPVVVAIASTVLIGSPTVAASIHPGPAPVRLHSGTDLLSGAGSSYQVLLAVSAAALDDVWAVGSQYVDAADANRVLAEHWNGTVWTTIEIPRVSGASEFDGVAAVSSDDVWAVGSQRLKPGQPLHTLIEHWDGDAWHRVPSPNPGGATRDSALAAVSAVDSDSVWAVGSIDPAGPGLARTLVVRWDGSRWSRVASPAPAGADRALTGISMTSRTAGWSVGSTHNDDQQPPFTKALAEHWNGHRWTQVATVNPGHRLNYLSSVAVVAPGDVWAVGGLQTGQLSAPLVEHFSHGHWLRVRPPGVDAESSLFGVAGDSATSVWVVGATAAHGLKALMMHWDGHQWHTYTGPHPAGTELYAVTAGGTAATWTVGQRFQEDVTTVKERWNGRIWTR